MLHGNVSNPLRVLEDFSERDKRVEKVLYRNENLIREVSTIQNYILVKEIQ